MKLLIFSTHLINIFGIHLKKVNILHEFSCPNINLLVQKEKAGPGRVAQWVGLLTRKSGPGFYTWSGNIRSFQERQLSVTGESMCTKNWLTV